VIEREDGTIVYFYRTNFITATELKASLEALVKIPSVAYKTLNGKDLQQNVLLIEGEVDAVAMAVETAAYFDVSAPQVFIEAKVIEITYESNFEFGLDYLMSRDQTGPNTLFRGAQSILNPSSFIQSTLPGGLPFQGTSLLFGFVGKQAEKFGLLDVTLQALQLEGKAEVLSKPSIICTQGLPAEVKTSESRWILQFQRADRNNENYIGSALNTGVTLTVTAKHIGESFVTMEVFPQVEGAQGITSSVGGTLQPIQTKRSAKTTVTMADGETLVIGGLYTNSSLKEKAKTPLLSDIPLLGELFTRTREAKVKTELVFLLTPTIVRKTSDLKVITPPAELERLEGAEEGSTPRAPRAFCPPTAATMRRQPAAAPSAGPTPPSVPAAQSPAVLYPWSAPAGPSPAVSTPAPAQPPPVVSSRDPGPSDPQPGGPGGPGR
jgi:type II secretory pathway component GspD/PulD (secretin)